MSLNHCSIYQNMKQYWSKYSSKVEELSEVWKPTSTRLSVLVQQWDSIMCPVQQVKSGICPYIHWLIAKTVGWGWRIHFHVLSTSTPSSIWCRVVEEERSRCRANMRDTSPTKVNRSGMRLRGKTVYTIMCSSEWIFKFSRSVFVLLAVLLALNIFYKIYHNR